MQRVEVAGKAEGGGVRVVVVQVGDIPDLCTQLRGTGEVISPGLSVHICVCI